MSLGVVLSVAWIVGVVVGVLAPWASVAGGLALALGVASVASVVAIRANERGRGVGRVALLMSCVAMAAAHGAQARDRVLSPDLGWVTAASDGPVTIEGILRRDAMVTDSGVRLELTVTQVRKPWRPAMSQREAWRRADIQVTVIVGGTLALEQVTTWTAGRTVQMPARLRLPTTIRNPGSPSVRWQRLSQPSQLVGSVKSGALVGVEPGSVLAEAAAAVRAHVRRVADQWLRPLGDQTRAVVTAILIGDRAGLDTDVVRRLQMAGTFHVIAISGGNVALLTALCFFALRVVCRGERLPTVVTLLVVIAYGSVVGRDASVARAVLAASLYLSLRLTGLVPGAGNVVAVTALICVVVDPLAVLDVGAWLSFGATVGLIVVLPRLMALGTQELALWRVVQGGVLATVAAEVALVPIAASVFMRVGIAGLLLNLVAIPAMTVVQLAGLGLCLGAAVAPGFASWLALIAHGATELLVGSASVVNIAPWLSWRVPAPPAGWVAAYYAGLVCALSWQGRRWVTRAAVALTATCGLTILLAPWAVTRLPQNGWLRVTVLDVGQGEAIGVQLPDGRQLLVDAGGSIGTFDVGGRVVTPALLALGMRRLDWLAITHGDVDHAGGALRVAEDLPVGEVWEGIPVPLLAPLLELRALAHDRRMLWRRLRAGDQIEAGPVLLDVLHPPGPDWERRRVRNDDSLVIRLRFGRVEMLLTGDAGAEFESSYQAADRRPPIRVLKVAHHGSRSSTSQSFLEAYDPSVAVVSAGVNNLFGHPSPPVIARLRARGTSVFRTDIEGAVMLETDGAELRVRTIAGRELAVSVRPSPVARPLPSPRSLPRAPTSLAPRGRPPTP